MTAYPCAGCGRVVVVETVFCVDCSRSLDPSPISPRLTVAGCDAATVVPANDATLIFDVGAS